MKTFRLFSMAAVALVMAACSNNDDAIDEAAPAGARSIPFTATISGTISVGTDGEAVTVVYPAASVEAGTGATPTPNAAYIAKGLTQNGTLEYIQDNLDARQGTGTLKVSGDPAVATLNGNVQLASGIAIWKLSLTDGTNALSATSLTLKTGTTTIAAATSTGKSDYYVCVVPATMALLSGDFTIAATVGSDTYTYTKTGGLSLDDGKYYQSTVTMAKEATARTLAKATDEDKGKMAGADGRIYNTQAAATVANTTAVAMIAYVGSDTGDATYTHGLAIALADESGTMNWSTAISICASKTAVTGAAWLLPSRQQWKAMFKACGDKDVKYRTLNSAITTAGGTALKPIYLF